MSLSSSSIGKPRRDYLSGEATQKMIKCFLLYETQEANTANKRYHNVERKLRELKRKFGTRISRLYIRQCLHIGPVLKYIPALM